MANYFESSYVLNEESELEILSTGAALITVVATAAYEIENDKKKLNNRKKRLWSRQHLLERNKLCACKTVARELRVADSENYKRFLKMNENTFIDLLTRVRPFIKKRETKLRQPISPELRLVVTLRYLTSGMTFQDLGFYHKIGKSTLTRIIPETCIAISSALESFIEVPNTPDKWETIAQKFEHRWNFPHCIGALDGKHIAIRKPHNTVSQYYNYKKFFSIILLALVDAEYKFLFVDVGCNGRVPDGSLYQTSGLAEALSTNQLNIPPDKPVEGIEGDLPFIIVADEAFPIKKYLMKPYAKGNLNLKKRVFNYRCSRARRIVESTFGILANRFQIFHKPILLNPDKAKQIVYCCATLHNYLSHQSDIECCPPRLDDTDNYLCDIQHSPPRLDDSNNYNSDKHYCPPCQDNTECTNFNITNGLCRNGGTGALRAMPKQGRKHPVQEAQDIRDKLALYFCTKGAVSWQWHKVIEGNH